MATKVKDPVVSESHEDQQTSRLTAVSVRATAAGSSYSNVVYYVFQPLMPRIEEPFVCGEDYPSLVRAWDNKDDDIFDSV